MYVIAIILVLLLPVPLYIAFQSLFIKQRYQKGIMAVEAAYKRIIERHKLTILEVHRLINRLIAIDRNNGKLVLLVYNDGITWEKCVDVEDISNCQVVKVSDQVSGCILKVLMEMTLNNDEIIGFPFFDGNIDDMRDLTRRIKNAEYWRRKVISCQKQSLNDYRLNYV